MAQDLIEKIRAAAQAKGVDPEVALGIARAESGLDPNAKAKTSSASGLFQILNSTWAGNKGTPGKQFDSDENIRVGTDIISKNVQSLKGFLGRDPSPKEVYAAHYFGATGAQKFLSAAPDTPTKQLFSEKVLAANPNLKNKTAGEVLVQLEGKLKIPTSNVPRETSVAKKEREPLPPSLPPMAQAEPAPARATMAKMDMSSMPASYQAAFALAALADAQDEEDDRVYNENKPTQAEKLLAEYKPVNHLASLDLGVTPINFADGGEVDEDKGSEDIKYFSNVDRMKERGTTIDSVMLGARKKAGEGSFLAGLNMANMSKDEKLQTARALMAAYTHQDPQGVGINANVIKPLNPKGPAMANLLGSIPVGEGRVSAGLHGGKAFSLGYNQPIEGGQFNANLNIPRGNPSAAQLNLQYNKRFAEGGEVEGEDLTKPSFGNPNIRKQGEAARRLAAMRDVNTLPDPKTYAAVAGALGTRPDQMGFSVLNPKYKEIMDVANPAFYAGTALQIAPVAQGPGMGRMVGAAERALEPAVRRTLEGGGKASEMLQALAAPPSQMFVRARPEAIIRHAQLSAKGLSPEEIRVQNLTHVDNRGNLLEEISDASAVLQQKTAFVPRNYYEMLKHPELQGIYPTYDMPDVMMGTTKRKGAPLAMGTFNVQDNRIMGNIRDLPQDDARGMVRGTLLHEGQHAIQEIEGFTGGANPGAFIAYVKARQGKYNADPTVNENVIREMERAYPNLSSVADNFTTRLQADKYMKYAVGDPDRYVGETLYRHMPGEVQAELARVRSNLSPEQLKATPHEVSMQQLGIDPANILVMNKMGSRPDKQIGDVDYDPSSYANGGPVYRADGSPETGEQLTPQQIERIAAQEAAEREAASTPAFIAQKSGIGRKAGPVSQALQSGQGQIEFLKGMTNVPQNILGAPMDISNMVASIYGGNVEKPFMGSEYIKEGLRKKGLGFTPSTDPTLAGFYGAGDLGSNLVNPAGLTRTGVQAVGKTGEAVKGTASDLLAKYQATQAPKPKMMTDLMTGQQFEIGGEDYIRQQFANIAAQRRANATNVLGEMPRMQTPQTEPPIPVGWGEVDVTPGEVLDAQQALRAQRAEREAQQAAQNAQQQPQQLALPLEAPVQPPVALTAPVPAPKVTSVAPPVTMESTVTPSNPFVGRLDNFVATLKGPVTKDQLLGQLRSKFRDYDLNRVEQALEDLKPTDKIKPADLKQRLDNMFSPRDFRLGIVEPNPQAAGIHNLGMDNPFIDDKTKQMGVINLLMETPKEKLLVHRETSDAYAAFEQFKGFTNTPEQIQLLKDFFVKTSPEKATTLTADLDALTPYVNKIKEKRAILGEVVNAVDLPILSKKWTRIQYEMAQQYPDVYANFDKYKPLIDEAVIKEGLKDIQQNFGLTPPPFSLYKQDPNAFKEATRKTLTPLNNELTTAENDVKQAMAPIGKEIESLIQGRRLYRGQHSNLNEPYNQNNPVAFSRFTDHEALIGDQGTKSGMYVHELQSDRFDDLIKKGPKGGSSEKDKKELIALNIQIRDKVNMPIYDGTPKGGEKYGAEIGPASDRLNIFNRAADAVSISYDKIGSTKKINELFAAYPNEKELIKDAIKIAQRQRVLSSSQRIGSQAHQLEESFAGMETSPQVVQQLLAKNAIVAAMQRGKEFVAFPGKESSQSQLYEKLPANLKQVVKDLGSGFEIRPIELPVGDVDALNTLGVTWSPEAAARILKTGVPFNKGGMVERQANDNRRYL